MVDLNKRFLQNFLFIKFIFSEKFKILSEHTKFRRNFLVSAEHNLFGQFRRNNFILKNKNKDLLKKKISSKKDFIEMFLKVRADNIGLVTSKK